MECHAYAASGKQFLKTCRGNATARLPVKLAALSYVYTALVMRRLIPNCLTLSCQQFIIAPGYDHLLLSGLETTCSLVSLPLRHRVERALYDCTYVAA